MINFGDAKQRATIQNQHQTVFLFCWIAGGKGAKERGEVESNLKTHSIQIWVFERKCAHCGNSVVKSADRT